MDWYKDKTKKYSQHSINEITNLRQTASYGEPVNQKQFAMLGANYISEWLNLKGSLTRLKSKPD